MVLWLVAWTVGCVALVGMVIREPRLFSFLFAIPFWASWFFVFFTLVYMFFGREQFVLDHGGATFQRCALLPFRTRFTPLAEIHAFEITTKVVDSETGQKQPLLEMRTSGRSLQLLQGISLQELQWLRWQLNEHLDLLKQAVAYATSGEPGATTESVAPPQLAAGESQTLELAAASVASPSDSRWAQMEGLDDFTFVQTGRFTWSGIGGLLFINFFWNGMVSVFVALLLGLAPVDNPPTGLAWWGLFAFLIPFEAIGLCMFVGLMAALFDPVRRTSWTFTRQSIECRLKWLGIGPAWNWPVEQLQRIEIRRNDPAAKQTFLSGLKFSSSMGDGGPGYRLLMIDRRNRELCSIDDLTEGEARWIGDVLLRQRREWFRT